MHAKLTWEIVCEIRQREAAGVSRPQLCEDYGISYTHLCAILRYDFWKEPPKPVKENGILLCKLCGEESENFWRVCKSCSEARVIKQYEKLKLQMIKRCEICGTADLPRNRISHCADHNHETGEFRGALCLKCNAAIGMLGENPRMAEKLAAYLRERGYSVTRTILS